MDVILEQAKTSLERNVSEFMDVNKLEEWATLNGLQNDTLVQRRMNVLQKKFICMVCSKKYAYKHTLKRHVQIEHSNNFRFDCKTCQKTFNRKDVLLRHSKNCRKKVRYI